jgi:hypothetical protein
MIATLIAGYAELAEWLVLFAFIAFVCSAVLAMGQRPDPSRGALIPLGLALAALAWLVL